MKKEYPDNTSLSALPTLHQVKCLFAINDYVAAVRVILRRILKVRK